jgi:hypothetical protein
MGREMRYLLDVVPTVAHDSLVKRVKAELLPSHVEQVFVR